MQLSDYSFHDSVIIKVTEHPAEQALSFLIDFPVDWDNNIFEKRILRFNDVIAYTINEIPFGQNPTIMDIEEHGSIVANFGSGNNAISAERNLVTIVTNAGKRTIQYSTIELTK